MTAKKETTQADRAMGIKQNNKTSDQIIQLKRIKEILYYTNQRISETGYLVVGPRSREFYFISLNEVEFFFFRKKHFIKDDDYRRILEITEPTKFLIDWKSRIVKPDDKCEDYKERLNKIYNEQKQKYYIKSIGRSPAHNGFMLVNRSHRMQMFENLNEVERHLRRSYGYRLWMSYNDDLT